MNLKKSTSDKNNHLKQKNQHNKQQEGKHIPKANNLAQAYLKQMPLGPLKALSMLIPR